MSIFLTYCFSHCFSTKVPVEKRKTVLKNKIDIVATKYAGWAVVDPSGSPLSSWSVNSSTTSGFSTELKQATQVAWASSKNLFLRPVLNAISTIYNQAIHYVSPTVSSATISKVGDSELSGGIYTTNFTIDNTDNKSALDKPIYIEMKDGSTFSSNNITIDGGELSADGTQYIFKTGVSNFTVKMTEPSTSTYDV